jgi:hypothetical protein
MQNDDQQPKPSEQTDEDVAYLRWHVTHLVRIWTSLGAIRRIRGNEMFELLKDVCSDKLRIMLHELAEKKRSMGFDRDGSDKHKRLYKKLEVANEWFTSKNGPHARNCSGAHLQPLSAAKHAFQIFGYCGEREWRKLTLGVAACVGMIKLIEGSRHNLCWRDLRRKVREGKQEQFRGLSVPASIEAFLLDFKVS